MRSIYYRIGLKGSYRKLIQLSLAWMLSTAHVLHAQTIECGMEDLLWQDDTGSNFRFPSDLWQEGDLLYLSRSYGLKIYQLSDSSFPTLLATHSSAADIHFGRGITIDGIGYFASGNDGLSIIDLTDPTAALHIASVLTGGKANDIVVSDGFAYIANQQGVLQIYDVTNKAQPLLTGSVETIDFIQRAEKQGNTVFLSSFDTFVCIDVSDPQSPSVVYEHTSPNRVQSVTPHGDYAYVTTRNGLETYDISDVSQPLLVSTEPGVYAAAGGSVAGDSFSCADFANGLITYDISDPASPILLGTRSQITEAAVTLLDGSNCYVASNRRLSVFDISETRESAYLGTIPRTTGIGSDMFSASSTTGLFYSCIGDVIQCIDVTDPTSPLTLSEYTAPRSIAAIAVDGDYVYAAIRNHGIYSIDYSDPENPEIVGIYDYTSGLKSLDALNGYLYFVDSNGLHRLSLADPSDIGEVGLLDIGSTGNHIDSCISDGTYYAIYDYGRIHIIDISNPATLNQLGVYDSDPIPLNEHGFFSVSDGIAVYGNSSVDYRFADLSDPENTMYLGTREPLEHASRAVMSERKAYLLDCDLGVEVIDYADPLNPIRVGKFGRNEAGVDIGVYDDMCFFADMLYGYRIVQIGDCPRPCLPDSNDDGILSPSDFTAWINAFNNQLPQCDQNRDGQCSPSDFTAWIANFNAGC